MTNGKITEQEWEVFLGVADRLGMDVRTLLKEDVRFHDLEAAGHALGRAVAQATTEWLAFARAERLTDLRTALSLGSSGPPFGNH